MAKFRQNHVRTSKSSIVRILIIVMLAIAMYVLLNNFSGLFKNVLSEETTSGNVLTVDEINESHYFIPSNSNGELIHHKRYSLSYVEDEEIAEWVAYVLTKKDLQKKNVKRAKRFNSDPLLDSGSAHYRDYSNSGYTRGHLAPAADMADEEQIMYESFYMSNITPQVRAFNAGVWNELENLVRDWAYKNERLIVVTGPVMSSVKNHIGKNKVGVPELFYKVLLDFDGTNKKAVGFVIPNEVSTKKLDEYMVSVDEVEKITGLDFFANILDEATQKSVEESYDEKSWPLNQSLYIKRIKNWNKR